VENILLEALKTSSIDFNIDSDEKYQYELIANGEEKIVTRLRKYFEDCDEFIISVAFITMGGISLFLEELKNLENKGIKGKILTGDYLTFTEPKALKKLLSYKNIDLKVATNRKHHTKAYFFRKGNIWTLIVGSSNLTQGALTVNFEWNIKVNSLENGKIVKSVLETFNREFDSLKTLTEEDFFETASEVKFTSMFLDYFPIKYRNFSKMFVPLKITSLGVTNVDFGFTTLDNVSIKILEFSKFKLIEFRKKEFRIAIDSEDDLFEYEIFKNIKNSKLRYVFEFFINLFQGANIKFNFSDDKYELSFHNHIEHFKFITLNEFLSQYEKLVTDLRVYKYKNLSSAENSPTMSPNFPIGVIEMM